MSQAQADPAEIFGKFPLSSSWKPDMYVFRTTGTCFHLLCKRAGIAFPSWVWLEWFMFCLYLLLCVSFILLHKAACLCCQFISQVTNSCLLFFPPASAVGRLHCCCEGTGRQIVVCLGLIALPVNRHWPTSGITERGEQKICISQILPDVFLRYCNIGMCTSQMFSCISLT